eukprot:6482271-Amphidinium_carterae.1
MQNHSRPKMNPAVELELSSTLQQWNTAAVALQPQLLHLKVMSVSGWVILECGKRFLPERTTN